MLLYFEDRRSGKWKIQSIKYEMRREKMTVGKGKI